MFSPESISGQVQIFKFAIENLKSGRVQIFYFQLKSKNLDASRFFIFNKKKSGNVQILYFQFKNKNLDVSGFSDFNEKNKIWTGYNIEVKINSVRPDLYLSVKK